MKKLFSLIEALLLCIAIIIFASSCDISGTDSDDGDDEGNGKHTHEYGSLLYNDTHHWYECEVCGEKTGKASHDPVGGVCECGYESEEEHVCAFASVYSYDDENHWHACEDINCTERSGVEPHEYVGGVCECGRTEETAHVCIFSDTLSYDESCHWYECTDTSCNITTDRVEHTYTDGVCICGYEESKSHACEFSDIYSYDEFCHWYACKDSTCDKRSQNASHEFEGGVCVCGYFIKPESIVFDVSEAEVLVGDTLNLTVWISPENAAVPVIEFTSSSPAIATVDENGVVTAVSAGTSIITASVDGLETSCEVSVILPGLEGLVFELSEDGTYYTVFSADPDMISGDIALPETYNGLPVSEISRSAFAYCSDITSISIPESIISIGDYAFENCSGIREIGIHAKMTRIGKGAFRGCNTLEKLTVPFVGESAQITENSHLSYIFGRDANSWYTDPMPELLKTVVVTSSTEIPAEAFKNCKYIENVILCEGLQRIEESAFSGCDSLRTVSLPESLSSIGNSAFFYVTEPIVIEYASTAENWARMQFGSWNSNGFYLNINGTEIKELAFEDLSEISDYAFRGCKSIETLSVLGNVQKIGSFAFENCTSLKKAAFSENSVEEIGDYAFMGCSLLGELKLCSGLISIGDSAFSSCGISEAAIPDSVKTIGESAFSYCESLIRVDLPASLSEMGGYAFYLCAKLETVNFDGTVLDSIGEYTFFGCNKLASVNIPNGVSVISEYAFGNCTALERITLGVGVRILEDHAFAGCDSVSYLNYTGTVDDWATIDFGFDNDLTSLATDLHINGVLLTEVRLTSASSISANAFTGCKSIKLVEIASCTEVIGASAFKGCVALETVVIKDGSVMKQIQTSAFENCVLIESIELPAGIVEIGHSAFYGCDALSYVNYLGDVDSWVSIEFGNANSNPANITNELHMNGLKLTKVTLSSAEKISDYSLGNLVSVTEITIPGSVTYIGEGALYGCSSLEKINYLGSVAEWAAIEFGYGWHSSSRPDLYVNGELATSADLSDVSRVSAYAFWGFEQITEVTFSDKLESIGEDAFVNCGLTDGLRINYSGTLDMWDNEVEKGYVATGYRLYIGGELVREFFE